MKHQFAAALVLLSTLPPVAQAASFSAGFDFVGDVPAEQTGMKVYPGATPIIKKNRESESANLQFSFGEYGLKVVAAKLKSADDPARVAQFYRDDLARFGKVLDCTDAGTPEPKAKKSKVLTCDGDRPEKNGMLFKAGTKDNQRLVEIRPRAEGTEISLVNVVLKNVD